MVVLPKADSCHICGIRVDHLPRFRHHHKDLILRDMSAGDLSGLVIDMWKAILDQLDTVTLLLLKRVSTEVNGIVTDYLEAAKDIRIDLHVLARMRSRRPWLLPRDPVVYNVLRFEMSAMADRINVENPEIQLIREGQSRRALEFLDTGAVVKKLLNTTHRKISIFRSLGRTEEGPLPYDFRDWIWCFGDYYSSSRDRPFEILLDGITIDLRFLMFKFVDREDENGEKLFSTVEMRNLTILGGITPPFHVRDPFWWGFNLDCALFIRIDYLSLKRDGSRKELESEFYAYIQNNYKNPMTEECRNELLKAGDAEFGHRNGRHAFTRVVRFWQRVGLLGGEISNNIVEWNDAKELVMTACDFVKWSFANYVDQLNYDGGY